MTHPTGGSLCRISYAKFVQNMNNSSPAAQFPGSLTGKRNDQACNRRVQFAVSRPIYLPSANTASRRFLNLAIIKLPEFKIVNFHLEFRLRMEFKLARLR
jgi:hypothetical protein